MVVEGYADSVRLSLIAIFASIILLNLDQLMSVISRSKEVCVCLLLSMAISGILFAGYAATFVSIAKVALILLFMVVHYEKNNHFLLKLADVGVLTLVALGVATGAGVEEASMISNGVWEKYSLGFMNPNIGPYFAFASLYVYFVMKAETRFWLLFLLIITSSIMFSIYSRTFLMGSVLLAVYQLVKRSHVDLVKVVRLFAWIVFFASVASVAVAVFLVLGEGAVNGVFGSIDAVSSARLFFMAKNPFVVSSSGPIIWMKAFDSIYYELVFILGPYVVFWLLVWWRLVAEIDRIIRLYPAEIYSILVFSLLGLFEGMIFKFSPMIVVVCSIVFVKIKGWIENSKECPQTEPLELCK